MTDELEKKLIEKYPKIFADCGKDETVSCMAFGLECGDGWYYLLDTLCEALTYTFTTSVRIDEEDGKRLGIKPTSWSDDPKPIYYFKVEAPQVIADQVKEKVGTLRFYYHLEYNKDNLSLVETKKYPELEEINKRYSSFIDGIIHFAETASAHTCEVTGEQGELYVRKGWLKTLSKKLVQTKPYAGYKPYIPSNEKEI